MEPELTKEELAAKLAEKRSVIDARLHGLRKEFSEAQGEFVDAVRDRALLSLLVVVGAGTLVGWGVSRWRSHRQATRIADYVVTDLGNNDGHSVMQAHASDERPIVIQQAAPPPKKRSFLGAVFSYAVRMLVAQGLVLGLDKLTSELLGSSEPGRRAATGDARPPAPDSGAD